MARGIGTLTVSVQANSAQAIKNLKDFKEEIASTALQAKSAAQDFMGLNVYGKAGQAAAATNNSIRQTTAEAAREMDDFRTKVVDLREDTDRYSSGLERNVAITKQLDHSLKAMKAIGKLVIPVTVAVTGFQAGKKLGDMLFKGDPQKELGDWWERTLDPGLVENRERQKAARADAQNRRMEVQQEKEKKAQQQKEEAQERAARKRMEIEQAISDAQGRAHLAAGGSQVDIDYWKNVGKFGVEAASKIAAEQRKADAAEKAKEVREEAARKQKEEERRKEREHLANVKRDQEAAQKVRDKLADFWKTDLQRQRDELLRTIEDPQLRQRISGDYGQLERLQRQKDLNQSLRTQFVGAQDPTSREGNAQRVRSLAQTTDMPRIAKAQLDRQNRIEAHTRRTADAIANWNFKPVGL